MSKYSAVIVSSNIACVGNTSLYSLQVHGLLHLLGFDHEISEEAEAEMEKNEEFLLQSLGWKGKGLIQSAYDSETNTNIQVENSDGNYIL